MTQHQSVVVAALQCAFGEDRAKNVEKVEGLVREAAGQGARIILPPELFEGPYFPRVEDEGFFALAHPVEGHPTLERFQGLCRELNVAVPVSFFERAGPAYYNSLAMVDADGSLLGVYRKSHIPDGPGYEEKFYFRPGDTGFKVWSTRHGKVGVGICWDQWFPEAARAMVLQGADVLFYPTAIGTEPLEPGLSTRDAWQRVMQGHAVANICPVVASNRVGTEGDQRFYGSSFITDWLGAKRAELGTADEGVLVEHIDLDLVRRKRAAFGFFRDRRPELYGVLATADGDRRGT